MKVEGRSQVASYQSAGTCIYVTSVQAGGRAVWRRRRWLCRWLRRWLRWSWCRRLGGAKLRFIGNQLRRRPMRSARLWCPWRGAAPSCWLHCARADTSRAQWGRYTNSLLIIYTIIEMWILLYIFFNNKTKKTVFVKPLPPYYPTLLSYS